MYTNPTTLSMNNVVNISQSYFFKPIHTFVEKQVAQQAECDQKQKHYESIHLISFSFSS